MDHWEVRVLRPTRGEFQAHEGTDEQEALDSFSTWKEQENIEQVNLYVNGDSAEVFKVPIKVSYAELTERQQRIIDKDSENQREWYLDGRGKLHGIEKSLLDLFHAQGGPDVDWRLVEFLADF